MGLFDFLKEAIIFAGVDHVLHNRGNNNHHDYDLGAWSMDDDQEMDSYDDFDCCDDADFDDFDF